MIYGSGMGQRRLAYVALAVGGVLLISASIGLFLLQNRVPYNVSVMGPSLVTTDRSATSIIEGHSTPSLAVDPAEPRHLVIGERIDRPRFGCLVHVSDDGGTTWSNTTLPLPEGLDTCFIPDVAFTKTAVLAVYLSLNTHPRDPLSGGNDPNGMFLARSEDGGRNFSIVFRFPDKDNLQPRIAVDSKTDRVYVVYVKGHRLQNDTPLGLGPPPNPIMVTSAVGGAPPFSDPVQVTDPPRLRTAAPTPAVGPDGKLYVLYEDYKNDLDDYHNRAITYRGTWNLMLATSNDEGKSFTQVVVDNAQVRPHPILIYLPPFPALAVAPDGKTLYAAWSDGRDGAPDVLIRRSDDAGKTWVSPVKIAQRKDGEPANFEMPAIIAPSAKRVEMIFYSLKGRQPRGSVLYTYSVDGGQRFQNPVAISKDFSATVGVPSARYFGAVDWGARIALTKVPDGSALAAWSDSSGATKDSGRQDIFISRITLN
ncbi:MAG: hypothetical protein NVS1B3_03050 [Candidatus Dormibacteraceae bacterium]